MSNDRKAGLAKPVTLLAAWDATAALSPHTRGPALLDLARPSAETALDLPLGEMTRLLAAVCAEAFGARVAAVVGCRGCGTQLDVDLDLARLAGAEPARYEPESMVGNMTVRTPTARDLVAAEHCADPAAEVVRRCVRDGEGAPAALDDLGETELAAVDAELDRRAGSFLPSVGGQCPVCSQPVHAALDTAALTWAQVRAKAGRLLGDVADLAAAFGWTEAEVLALPEHRRAAYLELTRT